MVLTLESAGALVSGTKRSEVIMEAKTIKVLRAFYINGVIQEAGKIIEASENEAKAWISTNKAEYAPELPPKKEILEEKPKKEETEAEPLKTKEGSAEIKKGGKKNDSI